MLLLPLFAAAAVQIAPGPPPAQQAPPSADVRQTLACPSTGGLLAQAPLAGRNAIHPLAAEPDAHMIRPVIRNYCEQRDVVRYNVTGDQPKAAHPPITDIIRPGALQPAGR